MLTAGLQLRKVSNEDCKLVWEWANDPEARRLSFSSGSISWEDHCRWFEAKLKDPQCVYYIGANESGTSIGQIRFDIKNKEATISLSVDPKFRGQGYGIMLIRLATRKLFAQTQVNRLYAYVKPENEMSKRLFQNAGFEETKTLELYQQPAVCFCLLKGDTLESSNSY